MRRGKKEGRGNETTTNVKVKAFLESTGTRNSTTNYMSYQKDSAKKIPRGANRFYLLTLTVSLVGAITSQHITTVAQCMKIKLVKESELQ